MLSYAILAFSSILFHSPKDCLTNLREGFVRILKMYAVSAYDLAYSPYFRIQNLLALLLEENVCRSMQSPEYGVENPCMPLERVSSLHSSTCVACQVTKQHAVEVKGSNQRKYTQIKKMSLFN